MGHFIELCKVCRAVISQCRCPAKDKEVKYGLCAQCAAKAIMRDKELNTHDND